jgi:hypothetical protein
MVLYPLEFEAVETVASALLGVLACHACLVAWTIVLMYVCTWLTHLGTRDAD